MGWGSPLKGRGSIEQGGSQEAGYHLDASLGFFKAEIRVRDRKGDEPVGPVGPTRCPGASSESLSLTSSL